MTHTMAGGFVSKLNQSLIGHYLRADYLFRGIHNPDVPGLTFEENIENLIHEQYTLGGLNDSDAAKNLLDFYWKLKSGRIRIVALSDLYPDGDLAR